MDASRDGNNIATLLGVSSVDGSTPVKIYADPTTHRLLVTGFSTADSIVIGTTVVTGGTTGSVLFVGTGGLLAQDNANFFWDDSNNRLGVLTNTPGTQVSVVGTGGNPSLLLSSGSSNPGLNNSGGIQFGYGNTSNSLAANRVSRIMGVTQAGGGGDIWFETAASTAAAWDTRMVILRNGNVVIGATTGEAMLHVVSNNLGGTDPGDASGMLIQNATPAAVNAQQVSPSFTWQGQGWKTAATAASQKVEFNAHVIPIQDSTAPRGVWRLQASINDATYNNTLAVENNGNTTVSGTLTALGTIIGGNGGSTTIAFGAPATTNFSSIASNIASFTSAAVPLGTYGGAAGVSLRNIFAGALATNPMTANYNYGNVVVGSSGLLTAATGTHTFLANLVVRPLGTVTAGGAAVTNTASLYIESASSAGTNNYALYSAAGTNYFGGRTEFYEPAKLAQYTVGTLPAGVRGDIAYVTDALTPTFGATVVAGGSVVIPVFYNGTNWIVA